MALYLISYDIAEEDAAEYEPLYAKLEEINATKILLSVWVVVDKVGRASSIYDVIAPLTNAKDRLLVQELGSDAQWDNLLITDDEFKALLKRARR